MEGLSQAVEVAPVRVVVDELVRISRRTRKQRTTRVGKIRKAQVREERERGRVAPRDLRVEAPDRAETATSRP